MAYNMKLSEDENTLEFNGVVLKACDEPVNGGCFGCMFRFDDSVEDCTVFKCVRSERKDSRNIVWKE